MEARFSINQQLNHATVFLTGASGFIGGLVLEQLLRLTQCPRVLVLFRSRHGHGGVRFRGGKVTVPMAYQDARARLDELLQKSPLFRLVRGNTAMMARVEAVCGDLLTEGLGLSMEDRARVHQEATVFIHSAASIELEADIHDTLRANYMGTQHVLELARGCAATSAFVHISSTYANHNQPIGAAVHERVYALRHAAQQADPLEVVQELLSLPHSRAKLRASALVHYWGFPNTYCLGKHLTEHLVASFQAAYGLPVAIVRPSFCIAVAGEPCPGYCTNWAGPQGIAAAYAMGFFGSLDAVAIRPHHLYDLIPGDVVANIILATAAAVCAGADRAILEAASAAGLAGAPTSSGFEPASYTQCTAAAQAAAALAPSTGVLGSSSAAYTGAVPPFLVVHAATSTTYPVTAGEAWNRVAEWVEKHPPPFRLSWRYPGRMPPDYIPDARKVAAGKCWTGMKVRSMCSMLRLTGAHKEAARLRAGFESWKIYNKLETDTDPRFSTFVLQALEAAVAREELHDWMIVWRPTVRVELASHTHEPPTGAAARVQPVDCKAYAGTEVPNLHAVPAARSRAYFTARGTPQPMFCNWEDFTEPFFIGVYKKLYGMKVEEGSWVRVQGAAGWHKCSRKCRSPCPYQQAAEASQNRIAPH